MTQSNRQPALSPRRRWLRFRLRSLMLFTAAVAAGLAFYFSSAKRAERAVRSLQSSGAEVLFDYQRRADGSTYSHQAEPPGPSAIRRIAGEGFFQDADWLRLENKVIPADGLALIAQLPSLRRLNVTNCNIGDEHLVHLGNLRQLVSLDLKGNRITDAGLFQLRGMLRLEILSLAKNQIQGDGLKHISGIAQLKELYLHDNPVSDEHLAHIVRMTNLEHLALAGTKITDDALEHLANLKNLSYLGLTRTKVTEAGIEKLQRVLPNCEIEH